jgi:hypothetical protein
MTTASPIQWRNEMSEKRTQPMPPTAVSNKKGMAALLLFVGALIALPASAADSGLWTNLESLRPGDRIGVIQTNQRRIEGKFQSASDSEITLDTGGKVSVQKTDVVRVYRKGMSRTKKILIGTAAGLAAGGAIAAGVYQGSSNEGFFSNGAATWLTVASGAGVGAGIGALTGSGYRTVYRASENFRSGARISRMEQPHD